MNALRLLLGTLTVLPVRPPTSVDRRTAGWAMTLAPLVGLMLAVLVAGPLALAEAYADPPPLLAGALCVGALAVLTRAVHLDGLADTADGLGSGRRDDAALEIMKRSDIGPFGVVTLVLVLLLQVVALATCIAEGFGAAALAAALVISRGVLPVLCTEAFPAARANGLGVVVAGSVSRGLAAVGMLLTAVLWAAFAAIEWDGNPNADALALAPLGLVAGILLARHARARFGGVTGDVYGGAVEATFTTVLVVAALA